MTVTGASYGLGMPAARRPAPADAEAARHILLAGLARDTAISDLLTETEPPRPGWDRPGDLLGAVLEVAFVVGIAGIRPGRSGARRVLE